MSFSIFLSPLWILPRLPLLQLLRVQAAPVPPSTMDLTLSDTSGPPAIFNEFLKWYEDHQNSRSIASVAHTGISFAGLTHSNSLDSWILDSGATDHIAGNKSFFSSLSTSGHLPSITMANGSKVSSHGVGAIHFFLLCLLIMFFMSLGHF